MGIFWRPQGGHWQGSGPVGFGELYDSAAKVVKKGNFAGGRLVDPSGQWIDYASGAIMYIGNFADDVKDGLFTVYVVAPDVWQDIPSDTPTTVACTKKNVTYTADAAGADQNVENISVRVYFCSNSMGCFTSLNFSS